MTQTDPADTRPSSPAASRHERDRGIRAAWILGLGGLTPFVLMTAMLVYAGRDFIAYRQLILAYAGYSATILAFLGGIRWGAALDPATRRPATLILSVLPALAAWLVLFLPSPWLFAGFALLFLLQGLWDAMAARAAALPDWFGRLRMVLSAVVVLCQVVAFVSTY
ncbi:DUF3429 family protein [Aurantimonas aggregata]|uniref:DUF3429 family protein n=1 Tax=Aurantimonas aggregata TaxID=2047720 RepID=A0A6L9MDJ8_9HYPH|nr:DUF3429 domain-containing protein [Aurantimonas aggregata]NDV85899.1 DUF3429 family protein [Aurantimonas aggregata]